MVGVVSFNLDLKPLEEALKLLPEAVAGRALDSAGNAGAKVIRDEMAKRAPVRHDGKAKKVSARSQQTRAPGNLQKNIVIRRDKSMATSVALNIGTSRRAFYGMFTEFGSKHQAATPWARPAFEAVKEAALTTSLNRLGANIEREAKRLERRVSSRYLKKGK